MSLLRLVSGVLLAGFIAERLAAPDADVEAGIEAYEAGELDEALARFDAAVQRRGDRPELSYDRGLVLLAKEDAEAARTAFLHATESERPDVRSSAFYELGNLAFDAEDWEGAIEAYIDCLKARPDHANAKWNLELALQKKKEQEEQQKKDEEEKQDEEKQDEEKQEDEKQEDEKQEDEKQEDEKQEDEKQEDEKQEDEKQDDQKQDDQKQDDQKQDDQKQDDQKQDDQKQEPPPSAPQPQALDQMDIDQALDDLDSQDDFVLDRPIGRPQTPSKDW